jgi:parallel beta-helix repeat protein
MKNFQFRILIISLLLALSELITQDSEFIYAQTAKVKVPTDVTTQTIILDPQLAEPAPPVEGQIYYRGGDPYHKLYYYANGWRIFSAQDKNVATRIVAAFNSDLTDKTADYTCDGTQAMGGDEIEINQAITDLGTKGGVVYLLEGTFWITNSIRVPSNVAIIGTGAGTVISPKNSAPITNSGVIINSDSTGGNNYILLQNFRIDGNKANNINTQFGIYFIKVTSSKVDRLWVENMKYAGISIWGASYNNIISGNNIQLNTSTGMEVYSSGSIVSGNNVQSNGSGINLFGENNVISGNNVQSNQTFGINLFGSSNVISGNNVQSYSGGGDGITLFGSGNTISNNTIWSNRYGIFCNLSNYNILSGNNIKSNTWDGIYLYNSSNNTLLGNVIYDNGGSGTSYDGIEISYNSDNNIISSNLLFDSAGGSFPINIGSVDSGSYISENNYVAGNQINWSVVCTDCKRINDVGTNTKYTDKVKITLEPGSYTGLTTGSTLTPVGPTNYLELRPTAPVTLKTTKAIADGNLVGDLLILKNCSTNCGITISSSGNVWLDMVQHPTGSVTLDINDTLSLIYVGIGAGWMEVGYADNSP